MDQSPITNIDYTFTYLWYIKSFDIKSKLNRGETITSPTFSGCKNKNLTWCLKLNKKLSQSSQYFLTLSLNLTSSHKTEVRSKYKISVFNTKGVRASFIFQTENPRTFQKESEVCFKIIKWNNLLFKSYNLLWGGELKICCKLSVLSDITQSGIQVPECRLTEDFATIFETKKLSDAILTVANGKEIPVHKIILAARSPVFTAMFEHEMVERQLNRVNITDIDYETLYELLKFIYTGKVENLETMAGELLVAADKYALERLKLLCEKELCTNLSIENAAELLQLADLHGANQLKSQAIQFINNNPEVIDTMEWKQLKETSPRLLADVNEELVTSKIS